MKLLSRTRCFKHTQETAAGGKAVGVYLKKNTIARLRSRELDSQESWMTYSEQALIFGWSSGFSGTELLADADAGEAALKH